MIIESLYFSGFKLLALNGLNELTINNFKSINLILGRNGSGKTTIMSRMIPHVPNKRDYNTPGKYELKWKANNQSFCIKAEFKEGSVEHYFIVDGVNLNDGHTSKVQQRLIVEHTGITQDVYDLMIGDIKFTDLTPAKRREWMMLLSAADLGYVESLHGTARSRINQSKGVLAHLNKKLAQEMDKVLDAEKVETLTSDAHTIQDTITKIQRQYDASLTTPSNQLWESTKKEAAYFKQLLDHAMAINIDPPFHISISKLTDLEELIQEKETTLAKLSSRRDTLTEEYSQLSHLVDNIKKEGVDNIDELEKEHQQVREHYFALETSLKNAPWWDADRTIKETQTDFHLLAQQLTMLVPEITVTPTLVNWDGEYKKYKSLASATNDEITVTRNQLERVKAKLEHLENCEKTHCPKCTHSFIPNVPDDGVDKLKMMLDKLSSKEESQQLEYAEYKSLEEKAYHQIQTINQIKTLVNAYSDHMVFWNAVLADGLFYKDPGAIYGLITNYGSYVNDWNDFARTHERLASLVSILTSIQKASAGKFDIKGRIEIIEDQNAGIERKIRSETYQRKMLVDYRTRLHDFMAQVNFVCQSKNKLESMLDDLFKTKANEMFDEEVRKQLVSLSTIQRNIHEQDVVQRIIADLKSSIESEKERHEGFILLAKTLGPKEGLIADQITHYIEELCLQINSIIENSWSYSMEVLPCTDDGGDLDYRFPLDVMNGTLSPQDIKNGSAGQREIVNIAFKIVAQVSLNMQQFPLLLDEPGQNFDSGHVSLFMRYLNNLMSANGFSQLFMISHTFSGYGMFANASMIKLDHIEERSTFNA